jgi:hypothetical protein
MQVAPSKLVAIVSGTQGELTSALSVASTITNRSIEPGDTVALSSHHSRQREGHLPMINHVAAGR